MSVFSGGEKYYRLAEGVDQRAYNLEQQLSHMETNRQLLSEIRKARLAAAQTEYMTDQTTGEYISTSGQSAATANIYSTFGGAYSYSMDVNNVNQDLESVMLMSHALKKKGASADKRAATATQITMAVLAVAGGFLGAAALGGMVGAGVGVAAGGAVGAGGIRAIGGGKVARKVANKAAINYAITGATMAAGGALAGGAGAGGGSGATTGGTVEMAGGISKSTATVGGTTTVTGPTMAAPTAAAPSTSTAWLSSAKQIGEGLSMASNIKSMLTPDYSYVEDRYKKSLYRQRYNRIYA